MSKRGEGNRKKVLFFVTFLLQLTPVGGQPGGVEKKTPTDQSSNQGQWGKNWPQQSTHLDITRHLVPE